MLMEWSHITPFNGAVRSEILTFAEDLVLIGLLLISLGSFAPYRQAIGNKLSVEQQFEA